MPESSRTFRRKNITLDEATWGDLDRLAKEDRASHSAVVRRLILEEVRRRRSTSTPPADLGSDQP